MPGVSRDDDNEKSGYSPSPLTLYRTSGHVNHCMYLTPVLCWPPKGSIHHGTAASTDCDRSRQPGSKERRDLRTDVSPRKVTVPTTVRRWRRVASSAKRLLIICAGFTLCGAGLIMLVLPGPGILLVCLGLVVLATEYAWAEHALERTRSRAVDATKRLNSTRTARVAGAMSGAALITGGATAAVVLNGHRYIGVSVLVAGIGALAVLIPATQRLIDPPPREPPAGPAPRLSPDRSRGGVNRGT